MRAINVFWILKKFVEEKRDNVFHVLFSNLYISLSIKQELTTGVYEKLTFSEELKNIAFFSLKNVTIKAEYETNKTVMLS